MRNVHSFIYTNQKYEFEQEEDYRNKYRDEENEITDQKQRITRDFNEMMKNIKRMNNETEEENSFLYSDDNKSKKKEEKVPPVFIPQSKIDFESQNIRYPKYSPTIYPYVSPVKEKSPSKRFQERMSTIKFSESDNGNDDSF